MDSNTKSNKGAALVITLLIVATLTGLAVGFSDESGIELELSGYVRDGNRARQMALSGLELALALLDQDEDRNMDSLREDWSRFGPETFPEQIPDAVLFSGRIVDEFSKININSLITGNGQIGEQRAKQLIRLITTLGLDQNHINPVLDWLDTDDIERMEGAENYYYQSLDDPYECFNGPFLTISQVFLVKNMATINNIIDFLTIHSQGKININTASPEILQSLDEEIDAGVAQSIIDYRAGEDFLSISDLGKVPGINASLLNRISEWITVKSSAFCIKVDVTYQEAVARIRAVAVRNGDKSKLVYCQVM